jgi:hypothetical protein
MVRPPYPFSRHSKLSLPGSYCSTIPPPTPPTSCSIPRGTTPSSLIFGVPSQHPPRTCSSVTPPSPAGDLCWSISLMKSGTSSLFNSRPNLYSAGGARAPGEAVADHSSTAEYDEVSLPSPYALSRSRSTPSRYPGLKPCSADTSSPLARAIVHSRAVSQLFPVCPPLHLSPPPRSSFPFYSGSLRSRSPRFPYPVPRGWTSRLPR